MDNPYSIEIFKPIWSTGWFTNHGPHARQLESEFAMRSGYLECVLVGVEAIGVLMTFDALDGRISLSEHCSVTRNAQYFLSNTYCNDISCTDWLVVRTPQDVIDAPVGHQKVVVYLSDMDQIQSYTSWLLSDESNDSAFLSKAAVLLYPMRTGYPIDSQGGVAILLNDKELAARLRNVRSSYGAGTPMSVPKTANGRISEAQCLLALSGFTAT